MDTGKLQMPLLDPSNWVFFALKVLRNVVFFVFVFCFP